MGMSALFVFGGLVMGLSILSTADWSGGVLIGVGGMMALLFQFIGVLMNTDNYNAQMREKAVARFLSKEVSTQALQLHKRKRETSNKLIDDEEPSGSVLLSDDGELIHPYQQK